MKALAAKNRPHVASIKLQSDLFKRAFDLVFSIALLLALSPLILAITVLIHLSSKGNAIYVQPRIGKDGKVFRCYKFRTMHLDADKKLKALLAENPLLALEWARNQKLKNDPRIFALGKWLRRTSLDELPQFWNVVRGDLSVVGPRPYMVYQKKELGSLGSKILSVRPGITGLWQISGRSQTSFKRRIELDAAYIDKSGFFFDLLLICKTIPKMIVPKDAC